MNRQGVDAPPRPAGDRHQVPHGWRSKASRQTASETTSPITSPTTRPPAPDHQADHQTTSARPPAGTTSPDHQPPAPPTHRIIAPPDRQVARLAEDHQDEEDYAPASFREYVADAFNELRFVRNSPGSLRDQIEYARDGAYTTRIDGWWRRVNIVYAYLVAIPGLVVGYCVMWMFVRLSRALVAGPALLFVLMFLNRIPLIEIAIPDSFDFTNWF